MAYNLYEKQKLDEIIVGNKVKKISFHFATKRNLEIDIYENSGQILVNSTFYPTAIKGHVGTVLPMALVVWQVGVWNEKSRPGCISETIMDFHTWQRH